MSKTYVLDTNVPLHDPEAIFSFQDNNLIIPYVVLEEMEKFKGSPDEIGANAREFSRIVEKLRITGKLAEGVSLGEGLGTLSVVSNFELRQLAISNDNIILGTARAFPGAILVTKDVLLRIKADCAGVTVQDYIGQKTNPDLMGVIKRIDISAAAVDEFYSAGEIASPEGFPDGASAIVGEGKKTALARAKGGNLILVKKKETPSGVKPKNYEQTLLINALLDDSIDMVVCAGVAGCGKTLLSMAAGVEQVEKGKFDKVFITKSITPVGADIGFVKGSKAEKMAEWVKPFFDNLDFIIRGKGKRGPLLDDWIEETIEVDAITYARGRSLMNRFIIVDECQNLHPRIIKTLMSRVANSSKLVLLGDLQQIDSPYLDIRNNGLAYAMSRLVNKDNVAILNMKQSERGRLASMAVELL